MIDVQNINKTFHVPHDIMALVDVSTKIAAGEVIVVADLPDPAKARF